MEYNYGIHTCTLDVFFGSFVFKSVDRKD